MSAPAASGTTAPGPLRTARLLLRCWSRDDAPLLKQAVDESLPELQQWMPWAATEPSPLDSFAERIEKFRRAFVEGRDWTYGVFDAGETRVLGGAGLHARSEPGRLEIGYWIRSSETGKGLATEAAAALVERAFRLHGVEAVEVRCDARNAASAAVPRRLGFRHAATLAETDKAPDGGPRETLVWVLERPAAALARQAKNVGTGDP